MKTFGTKTFSTLAILAALVQPAAADTLLRLSETAHVAVPPDQIVATLRADGAAATAAEAQARVNAMVGKALDEARKVPGIATSTGSYQVWQRTQPSTQWNAGQTIALKGSDGAEMLKLVGRLQGQGLGLEQLAWQVSPEKARKAQSEATKIALGALRARAEEAAGILGLRFVSFREVRLDGSRPSPPMPRAMAMAVASAAPMPPPRAEAQDVDIQASVEADAVLVPAQP
ncbi:SIMPL domain-containing protein [Limobrevibacterium gyesilva]|uniref:SIMPL domain-containing protein n=1 Tax=Limobrevibacterium gyesilva TaxID=2991712 RepID=A0AA42CE57_9PROT|nr:SIMPL domain-containing protein [Limobrevibacterium gyesilva]MCW3473071.1 SIMPL domain-containing protein [Limobrevibacterium gyesilva]